jgi:hypothetical protein
MDQIENNWFETNFKFEGLRQDKNNSSFFDVYIIIKWLFLTSYQQLIASVYVTYAE